MGNETDLPDKVGELAEARSFEKGFRGAWFRCEIMQVGKCTDGVRRVLLKYYDFDDDTPEWLKLYKVTPWKSKYKELMLRPPYPHIYNAKEMAHASEISQVSVIVDDSWKVGDLVDWYTTGCFWSGTITKLLSDATAEIELHKPPHGEGLVYNIELKDVRPSLDWSPEYGWTMPTPTREGDCSRPSAWLLKPINQEAGKLQFMDTQNSGQETEAGKGTAGSSSPSVSEDVKTTVTTEESKKPSTSAAPAKPKSRQRKSKSSGCRDSKTDSGQQISVKPKSHDVADRDQINSRDIKTHSGQMTSAKPKADDVADGDQSDSHGCLDIKTDSGQQTSAKHKADDVAHRDHLDSASSMEQYSAGRGSILNCTRSDTLEASVLGLEECVNKVKWLKRILRHGISSANAPENQWEFLEPISAFNKAPK